MIKRIDRNLCIGIVVDVQEFFLNQLEPKVRARIEARTADMVSLLSYLRMPLVFTVERPLDSKGGIPGDISSATARTLEKDFFDLTGEKEITEHLRSLNKKQIVLAGCETDVCILQSCLGLLSLGYEVFVVEDLLFSSSSEVESSIERMKAAGATFLTYKTLFHELLQAVESGSHRKKIEELFGPFPKRCGVFE